MDTLPIINRVYEVYKTSIVITNHLQKRWRYSIGVSLENSLLDLLKELIIAKNAPKHLKSSYLLKAQSHLEISILKLRLMLELELIKKTQVFQTQAKLAEIGRMLGGWLKSLNI